MSYLKNVIKMKKKNNSFLFNFQNLNRRATVGIIVIGDEILKGSTLDENSNYICKRLHEKGVRVKKISVVGDEIDEIAEEVKKFSDSFDVVFTTGGLGFTHDDVTFAGIAKAFDDKLILNKNFSLIVKAFLEKAKIKNVDIEINDLCKIPSLANLLWFDENGEKEMVDNIVENHTIDSFPSFQIKNLIALPGVPTFCKRSFKYLENYLFEIKNPFFSKKIFLKCDEIYLQERLRKIAEENATKNVSIGSYPILNNNYYKTKLIVESDYESTGLVAYNQILNVFKDDVVEYDEKLWENAYEKIIKFRDSQSKEFQLKIDHVIETCNKVLDDYKLEDIMISFNGGKDCTILLHFFRACVDWRYGCGQKISSFHILYDDDFLELCEFVNDASKKYNLINKQIVATMKDGLAQLKAEFPNVVPVLMGSRSTDPKEKSINSNSKWTDDNWPKFLRVFPILNWSYFDVWNAIRGLNVPYCILYDKGYTSLGRQSLTSPNPALKIDGGYLPAFYLKDETLERCAR